MARHNHPKHTRKFNLVDRYDLDYVNLPEFPDLIRVVVKPLKTIYVNLDADFDAVDIHVARNMNDRILRAIEERI